MRRLAIAAGAFVVAIAIVGCSGDDGGGQGTTVVATVVPDPTDVGITEAPDVDATESDAVITDAEVAEIERELDEIDDLLNDLDSELAGD